MSRFTSMSGRIPNKSFYMNTINNQPNGSCIATNSF